MDLTVLRKRISSYKTSTGKLIKVPDELALEIVNAWEHWTGAAKGFYAELGVSRNKMARIIGKGKKLKREGFSETEFKEIGVIDSVTPLHTNTPTSTIELVWDNNKIIRFGNPAQLMDFLKMAV